MACNPHSTCVPTTCHPIQTPRLPPTQPSKTTSDKRTLRSQDEGPRLKSELAIYFPNYEDVILDAPQKEEFVTVDSAIYITDDSKRSEEHTSELSHSGESRMPSSA